MDQLRVTAVVKGFLRFCFILVNNVYTIPTYVVWMIIFTPIRYCQPELYWRIEGLFFHWLLSMVSLWSWSAGYDIVEIGDDFRHYINVPALVIANHQSTADVPLLMSAFNAKPNILPNIMWIMDRAFKFTNFGIVSILHQDFFIQSGRGRRDECLQELKDHIHSSFIPRQRHWMVLFPEGGFLRKRRETSQRYALKNNLPVLEHVSLPRTGAMEAIVEEVAVPFRDPKLKTNSVNHVTQSNLYNGPRLINWVLDITIAYPEGKPLDLPTIITGWRAPCKTLLFYRIFNMADVPRDQKAMSTWLFDRWVEKEEMLKQFYETGHFPSEKFSCNPIPEQVVTQDPLRYAILHIFFLVSSYVHYCLFNYVYQLL